MVTEYIKQGVVAGTFQVATCVCVCFLFLLVVDLSELYRNVSWRLF